MNMPALFTRCPDAKLLHCVLDQLANIDDFAHAGLYCNGLAAFGVDSDHHVLDLVRTLSIVHHDRGAFLSSRSAIARPMPFYAPVTMATFSVRERLS